MSAKCYSLLCINLFLILSLLPRSSSGKSRSNEDPTETEASKFLRHLDVIPDVIEVGPQEFLNVTYLGNIRADRGVELQPMQVRDEPTVKWIAGNDIYYTLLMIDPDSPDRMYHQQREYLHWLVINIPGDQFQLGDVRVAYMGSMPAKDSGLHRNVFLLYKQPDFLKIDFDKVPKHSDQGRIKFNTKEFAERYNLGFPLAGNFFTCSWSSDVSALHKAIFQGQGQTLAS